MSEENRDVKPWAEGNISWEQREGSEDKPGGEREGLSGGRLG